MKINDVRYKNYKVKMNIDYGFQYTEFDDNPISFMNSFKVV